MIIRFMAVALLAVVAAGGHAQDYPSRTITITVPNPPGGMNQIHAQPLSAVLERLTKQPAPIVNRPGGTAGVGTAYVANQPPDGYNILVTVPNIYLVIEKDKLYGVKSPFTLDQIALIALLSADPLIMFVHPSMPVKTVKQLIALAKARPNDIIFSSSGPYGITHTPTAMFLDATKTNYRFVSTVSVAESPVTTISGVVDAGAVSATIASGTGEVSYVKTGDGEWITDADGNWVVLEGEAPVNPPLDYLADSESLEVVSNDSSGLVLSGVLGPSAGTIAGVPFQVTILDGLLSTITYEGITGGEVAVVTTSLSDVGVAGTVTPPQ